ncbi:hypothetical protein L195_g037938 [Trifolium pratense]|uniref:Uncharacterized protein n=1 Tax=Trifolium pratense TaxID=57577 RepID=A0A2K3LTQ7_TRIPR|nr:hypothetical protein L195_g037938 [Trifolium pratense]
MIYRKWSLLTGPTSIIAGVVATVAVANFILVKNCSSLFTETIMQIPRLVDACEQCSQVLAPGRRFSHWVIGSYDPRGFFDLSSRRRRRRREPCRRLVYVCSHSSLTFVLTSLTFNHLFHPNLCPH